MLRRKILNVINLLGDSLYLLGPIKKFIELHKDEVASMVIMKGIAGELFIKCFSDSGVPIVYSEEEARLIAPDAEVLRFDAGRIGTICFAHEQRFGKCPHISEGFAKVLGVDIEGRITPPTEWQTHLGETFPKEHALICPFSRSCSRHSGGRPNKTLDDWKWEPIIHFMRRHKYQPVKVEGGPGERLNRCSILESDYLESYPLENIELSIKKASVVISLDSGLAHLSSAIGTKTIVFWPRASSLDFIAPKWSPTTAIIQIGDPNDIAPSQLLLGVRRMLAWLEDGKR